MLIVLDVQVTACRTGRGHTESGGYSLRSCSRKKYSLGRLGRVVVVSASTYIDPVLGCGALPGGSVCLI